MPTICAAAAVAVVAIAAAASAATPAPPILPPAHADGPVPGTLAFKFGSLGTADNEFDGIASVSIDSNGKIYVVDEGNSAIKVFHPNGTFDYALLRGDVQSLFFGLDWVLYASSLNSGYFAPFHPNGTLSGIINVSGARGIGPDGEIYKANRSKVHVYDPNGTRVFSFGSLGEDPGEFNYPHSFAADPDGKIYVTDNTNRIQVFHPNGTYAFQFADAEGSVLTFGPSGEYLLYNRLHHPNGTVVSHYLPDVQFGLTGMLVSHNNNRVFVFHGIEPTDEWPPPSLYEPPPDRGGG